MASGVRIKREGAATFSRKPALVDKAVEDAVEMLAPEWRCAADEIALYAVSSKDAAPAGSPLAEDVILRDGSFIVAKISPPAPAGK